MGRSNLGEPSFKLASGVSVPSSRSMDFGKEATSDRFDAGPEHREYRQLRNNRVEQETTSTDASSKMVRFSGAACECGRESLRDYSEGFWASS